MEQKIELKDAFSEFKKQKNIDRNIMISVLEDVFKTQLAKTYGSADNFDIIVNEKGDFEIFQNLEVVETVENPGTQIALADVDDDFEIGDLNARRGQIQGYEMRSGAQQIDAFVPLSEMFGYATNLRSRTQGRGQYTMEPSHYVELPKGLQEKLVNKHTGRED